MHPIPPPRRSATLPTPTPTPAFVADPLAVQHAAIAQQHHRSLVAYYWSFAQQGLVAPLTAAFGSDERARQELAQTEAVEWAKQCGIQVVEPGAPQQPVYALHTAGQHAIGALDAQPRLSTVPTPVGQTPSPALQRPLPTPQASTSATPAQTPVPPQRARPLPPRPPPARHSTASPGVPSTEPRQLEGRLEQLNLGSAISPSAAQPPAASAHRDPRAMPTEQSPAVPAVPTFSFSVGEDDDAPASAASPTPGVPTFSFACDGDEDEDDASAAGAPSSTPSRYVPPLPTPTAKPRAARPPPLHPRFDPSHPSHRLYHPTSVISPLSPTRPISHTNRDVPEAGTIACSACRDLIFGRVLHALGKSWHPDCFRCAEDGCGARLEVMEFEGTPEDRQGDEDSAAEGLRGKAWCMVHYEEVSTFAPRACSLTLGRGADNRERTGRSGLLSNVINVILRSLRPTTFPSRTLLSRRLRATGTLPLGTITRCTFSAPAVATRSSTQFSTNRDPLPPRLKSIRLCPTLRSKRNRISRTKGTRTATGATCGCGGRNARDVGRDSRRKMGSSSCQRKKAEGNGTKGASGVRCVSTCSTHPLNRVSSAMAAACAGD